MREDGHERRHDRRRAAGRGAATPSGRPVLARAARPHWRAPAAASAEVEAAVAAHGWAAVAASADEPARAFATQQHAACYGLAAADEPAFRRSALGWRVSTLGEPAAIDAATSFTAVRRAASNHAAGERLLYGGGRPTVRPDGGSQVSRPAITRPGLSALNTGGSRPSLTRPSQPGRPSFERPGQGAESRPNIGTRPSGRPEFAQRPPVPGQAGGTERLVHSRRWRVTQLATW